jgi:hypothetical protein
MGRGGQEGPGKRREPGRASPVSKPQLPSFRHSPGKPSREHNAPTRRGPHAAGGPRASPTCPDPADSQSAASRRPSHRPLMPTSGRPALRFRAMMLV